MNKTIVWKLGDFDMRVEIINRKSEGRMRHYATATNVVLTYAFDQMAALIMPSEWFEAGLEEIAVWTKSKTGPEHLRYHGLITEVMDLGDNNTRVISSDSLEITIPKNDRKTIF